MKMTMEALSAGGRGAQKFTSNVGAPPTDSAYHLVACGYLLLDDEADVGEGADRLGNLAHVALAVKLLAGGRGVADEVGS